MSISLISRAPNGVPSPLPMRLDVLTTFTVATTPMAQESLMRDVTCVLSPLSRPTRLHSISTFLEDRMKLPHLEIYGHLACQGKHTSSQYYFSSLKCLRSKCSVDPSVDR